MCLRSNSYYLLKVHGNGHNSLDLEAAAVAVTAAADGKSDQEAGTEAAVVLIQSDYDNNDEDEADPDIPSRDDGGLDIPSRDTSNHKKDDPTDDEGNMIGIVKEAQDNSAFSGGR